MSSSLDDEYVRQIALWIRTNELSLAGVRSPRPNALNPFSWVSTPQKPTILSLTRAQLSYLLTRIEGTGIDVGNLDIPIENPRPSQLLPKDVSDAQSITSFVSHLSLSPSSWWSKPTPIDVELKYIYSSFTKLPALRITNPPSRELDKHALPLDAFKNIQTLIMEDVDPRSIVGWDRLAEGLRSLTVKRSGMEDVSQLIVDAVADDENRRKKGDLTPIRRRPSRRTSLTRSRQPSWHSSLRGGTPAIREEDEDPPPVPSSSSSDSTPPLPKLSPSKWWALRHLCLADNGLTFFSTDVIPYLLSVTNLDLSNNLLVSVPPGLNELHRLTSLNLAGNMIESVLGIYTMLGQVMTLNLGSNRLDSLCGLERLGGLQRIDLRNNRIDESGEVGRLAALPDIAEVWVEGNPMTAREEDWRVKCYAYFVKEKKSVTLDGTPPGYMEAGRIAAIVGTPKAEPVTVMASPRPPVTSTPHTRTNSAAAAANGISTPPNGQHNGSTSASASPSLGASSPTPSYGATIHAQPRAKRRKHTRIVDLDEDPETPSRERSPASQTRQPTKPPSPGIGLNGGLPSSLPKGNGVAAIPSAPTIPEDENQDMEALLKSSEVASPPVIPIKQAYASATLGRKKQPTRMASGSSEVNEDIGALPVPSSTTNGRARRTNTNSATMSMGRSAKRRARVTASVYEPSPSGSPGTSPRKSQTMADNQLQFASEADAFRAKIEALRNEVGDSWLKVLSQSDKLGASPPLGRSPT